MNPNRIKISKATFVVVTGIFVALSDAAAPTTEPVNAAVGVTPSTTPAARPGASGLTFALDATAAYAFDTDVHDDGGSFSVFRTGGSLTLNTPLAAGNNLTVAFDGEYDHYFFRNFAAVPGDDGSDALDLYQFDLRPVFTHAFTDRLRAFGGLSVTASGESGAHFGDSLSYGVFAGVSYQFTPTLTAGVGLAVQTQLEDDPFFFPLVTLDWQITHDWTLAADGPGLKLSYAFDEKWTAYVGARYDARQFRFDSNEIVRNGVLSDQDVPVTVGVVCRPIEGLTVSGEVGVIAYRRLEVDSSTGHQVNADEADPALFAGLEVSYTF